VKRDDQITDINAAGESRDFERKLFRNFFWGRYDTLENITNINTGGCKIG